MLEYLISFLCWCCLLGLCVCRVSEENCYSRARRYDVTAMGMYSVSRPARLDAKELSKNNACNLSAN